jgi:hypothetical protein
MRALRALENQIDSFTEVLTLNPVLSDRRFGVAATN